MTRKLLIPISGCLFCLGMAWFAARIVIYFWGPQARPPFVQPAAPATAAMPAAVFEPVAYDAVLRRNLFHAALEPGARVGRGNAGAGGLSPAEEARMLAEMDRLPVSGQGWTLLGTIVNSLQPARSRAILLVDGKQAAMPPNANLKGWRIALIERRTVVVEKNGRRERLIVGGRDIAAPAPAAGRPRVSVNAREIESAFNDLPELMRQVGFAASQEGGVYGLSLTFVRPDSLPARLGLRQNDLLTRANGQSLANLGDLAGLGGLASQDSLRLELVRDGKNLVMEYDINR